MARAVHLHTAIKEAGRAAKAAGLDQVRDDWRESLLNLIAIVRTACVRTGRFVHSRRWLATAFGVSMAILLLIVAVKPRSFLRDSLAKADLPAVSEALTEPMIMAPAQLAASIADGAVFLDSNKRGLSTLAQPPVLRTPGPAEPQRNAPVTTAQYQHEPGRGAWLTGTIEEIADAPPSRTASNAFYQK